MDWDNIGSCNMVCRLIGGKPLFGPVVIYYVPKSELPMDISLSAYIEVIHFVNNSYFAEIHSKLHKK